MPEVRVLVSAADALSSVVPSGARGRSVLLLVRGGWVVFVGFVMPVKVNNKMIHNIL